MSQVLTSIEEEDRPLQPPKTSVRVVVAAAVRIYREGMVRSLLPRADVVGVAGGVAATLDAACRCDPDVVVLDIQMEGATELMRRLGEVMPGVRVVAFAVNEANEQDVLACAEAGAVGWVGPDGSASELAEAVIRAARDEVQVTPRAAAMLLRRVASLSRTRSSGEEIESPPRLTPREAEVGELLRDGMSNKAISSRLGMRPATVKNHVHKILEKLRVRSRGEAAARLRRIRAD